MAGRLRGGESVTGYAVALVLFAVLFVLSLVLAIVFKTQARDAQVRADQAVKLQRRIIDRSELDQPLIMAMMRQEDSPSVVGQILHENKQLKNLINASPDVGFDQIKAELNSLAAQMSAGPDASQQQFQTLIGEIQRLTVIKNATDEQSQRYQASYEESRKRLLTIEEDKAALAQEYDQAVQSLKQQSTALQKSLEDFQHASEEQRQALQGQLDLARDKMRQTISQLRSTIEQKDRQIDLQEQRLDEIKREYSGQTNQGGPDITRQPDGVIASIVSEEDQVYINRGSDDHILLGMSFEVFDKSGGVLVDDLGDLRGKATIEVISLSDRAALARTVRRNRGANLEEGDLIANIVYDPNVIYKFHVFGQFDLDQTGQATVTDRRRIETIVSRWGGILAPELSYSTDFLVLGQEPDLPKPLPPGEFDPKRIEEHAAKRRKFKTYQSLVAEAKALSIPILNQNRFLALVGYYHR